MKPRQDISALACRFRRLALLSVPLLTLALSACVTTQGGGATDGFPQFSLNSLTDVFSSEVREFRKLMTEGKTEQALAFFKEKEAYFAERYAKDDGKVPSEFTQLAEHVLNTEWRPRLLSARVGLTTVFGLADPKARADADAAWKQSMETQAAVESATLYKITRVGRDEMAALVSAREKFKERALAQKAEVLPTMLDAVLAGTERKVLLVGDLVLESGEFQASPGFQTAAVARMEAVTTPAELEKLAHRLASFLTQESQIKADRRFADLVRRTFMADGRISLEELAQLSRMITPLGAAPDALKGIVKVGYANVSRSTLQGRVAPEFPVNIREDYGLPLSPALDALAGRQPLDSYDFVLVVDVANAIAQRNMGSSQSVPSRYVSGKRREPNPDYPAAERALREAQQKKNEFDSKPLSCKGLKTSQCNALVIMNTYAGSNLISAVNSASERLEKTPRMLVKTDYTTYTYQTSDVRASKSADLPYFFIDVKAKQVFSGVHKLSDSANFKLVSNLHAQDENRSTAMSGAASEAEIQRWMRKDMEVGLSELFAESNLRKVNATSFDSLARLSQIVGGVRSQTNAVALKDDAPSVGSAFRLPQ